MTYIIKLGVEFGLVFIAKLTTFTSVQGKDTPLLLGGCDCVSGYELGETR